MNKKERAIQAINHFYKMEKEYSDKIAWCNARTKYYSGFVPGSIANKMKKINEKNLNYEIWETDTVNAIKNSFESARMHITEYIVNVIAKNNINDNKDNIVDNIKTIINAEFYNTYNTLSMYTINGINVATILKEQWKNDLIDNTIKLVYNSKLDKETKIFSYVSKLSISFENYIIYINNKVFK